MKRIALQYSGQIRNILDCFNNNYESLILKNPEYQVDIFAHLWNETDTTEEKRNRIRNLLNAKVIIFEDQRNFEDQSVIQDTRFPWYTSNMISQFFSIEAVNKIRKQYQEENNIEYDYVIRLRSDILFMADCINPIDFYEKDFIHIKDYTPFTEHNIDYAINDYFAISSPELIDIYSNVYTNLHSMILSGAAVNPECLLGYNIKNFPRKKHEFRMFPYRYAMSYLSEIRNCNVG